MTDYRTTFNLQNSNEKISYFSKCLFIGSCFTENMGNFLHEMRFPVVVNPTGIIYNPYSISQCIDFLINKRIFSDDDLIFYNEKYLSLLHHSRFSNPDKQVCLNKINTEMENASCFIKDAQFLFITLGTSFVYYHKEKNGIVANCHKLPSATFHKTLMSAAEITNNLSNAILSLNKLNPQIKIIFTISPVRHWKEGAVNNQLSKSTLLVAVHEIIKKFNNCIYFPAYELMMDDLRDYRFYADDMIHPSALAIEYIRDKFTSIFMENGTISLMNRIKKIVIASQHKVFNSNTLECQKFQQSFIKQIEEIEKEAPSINLKQLKDLFFR